MAAPVPAAPPAARRGLLDAALWVFVAALAIRVLWVAGATVTPIGDHFGYDRSAVHWIATGEFWQSISDLQYRVGGGGSRAYRTPGYPGFVALVYWIAGPNWGAVAVVQALLGALSAGLLVVLAGRLLSLRVGCIAGILHAFNPLSIVYVPVLTGENLLIFLMIAGLASLTLSAAPRRPRWTIVLSGLCLGLMLLTRPSSLFFLPAWIVLVLYDPLRRRWYPWQLVLCGMVTVLAVAPWLIRNGRLGLGYTTFSTQAGYALWWGNNWRTIDGANPEPPRFPGDRALSELEQTRFFKEQATAWIRNNPQRFLALSAVRLARLLGTPEDVWAAKYFWPTAENDRLICAVYWRDTADPADVAAGRALEQRNRRWHRQARALTAPLELVAVLLALLRPRRFAFVLLPLASYAGSLALTVFAGRYRVTSDPLLAVCLAALLSDLLFNTRETGRWLGRRGKLALVLAAVGASVAAQGFGWDRDWYRLPPAPAPAPEFDDRLGPLCVVDLAVAKVRPTSSAGVTAQLASRAEGSTVQLAADTATGALGHGGLRVDLPNAAAFQLELSCANPAAIEALVVSTVQPDGQPGPRWEWRVQQPGHLPGVPTRFTFVPGQTDGYFSTRRWRQPECVISGARIVARVKPGQACSLTVQRVRAAAALPPLPQQTAAIDLHPRRAYHATQSAGANCTVQLVDDALVGALAAAPDATAQDFGGVRIRTGAWHGVAFALTLAQPEDVRELLVVGSNAAGQPVRRWQWRLEQGVRPLAAARFEVRLVPGVPFAGFRQADPGGAPPIETLQIVMRVAAGRSVEFRLADLRVISGPVADSSPGPPDDTADVGADLDADDAAETVPDSGAEPPPADEPEDAAEVVPPAPRAGPDAGSRAG